MTEREAWLWLAEKWDKPKAWPYYPLQGVTDPVCVEIGVGGITIGLCVAIDYMLLDGQISRVAYETMNRRLPTSWQAGFCGHYKWSNDAAGAAARAAFCREQAAKCEAEKESATRP
jgi:hypothetical protein